MKGRLLIFKIPRDKPWAWPKKKLLFRPIEIQTHFIQEENRYAMEDTTGMKKWTTLRLPKLAVVPYAVVGWLSKKWRTPN